MSIKCPCCGSEFAFVFVAPVTPLPSPGYYPPVTVPFVTGPHPPFVTTPGGADMTCGNSMAHDIGGEG